MALAMIMTCAPVSEIVATFKEAYGRYSHLTNAGANKELVRYTTRAMMLAAEFAKQHGLFTEANYALMKAHYQASCSQADCLAAKGFSIGSYPKLLGFRLLGLRVLILVSHLSLESLHSYAAALPTACRAGSNSLLLALGATAKPNVLGIACVGGEPAVGAAAGAGRAVPATDAPAPAAQVRLPHDAGRAAL